MVGPRRSPRARRDAFGRDAAVSILVPPDAPEIGYVSGNEPYSTATDSLIAWNSRAPRRRTPVGPHIFVLEAQYDEDTTVYYRIERELEATIPVQLSLEIPGPGATGIYAIDGGNIWHYRAWVPRRGTMSFS